MAPAVSFVLVVCFACAALAEEEQWWKRTAGMRTISPRCDTLDFEGLLGGVQDLYEAGVRVFSVNAAYDSGSNYDASALWCGLGISDLYGLNEVIASKDSWDRLEAAVHDKKMRLVTWMNPSYFWTGSPHFMEAEKDIKFYGVNLDNLPTSSPARWFSWSKPNTSFPSKPTHKPRPDDMTGKWQWVYDADANASYFSVWGNQPTVDWARTEWQEEIKKVLKHWILEMKVDGFVFDYPDGYLSAGSDSKGFWTYTPELIKKHLTDQIHSIGEGQVAAFAELYEAPDRATAYGFDGSLSDRWDYIRFEAIAKAILQGNAASVEDAFTGAGGPDAIRAQCTLSEKKSCGVAWTRQVVGTAWLPGASLSENNYNCEQGAGATYAPNSSGVMNLSNCFHACSHDAKCDAITVRWHADDKSGVECFKRGGITNASECRASRKYPRKCDSCFFEFSTFDKDAAAKLRLNVAVTVAGGSLSAVELDGATAWWGNSDWPGSGKDEAMASLRNALESSPSFSTLASRVAIPLPDIGWYAMVRESSTDAVLAVFNFHNQDDSVEIDLSNHKALMGHSSKDLVTGRSLSSLSASHSLKLPAFGYALIQVSKSASSPFPIWGIVLIVLGCLSVLVVCVVIALHFRKDARVAEVDVISSSERQELPSSWTTAPRTQ